MRLIIAAVTALCILPNLTAGFTVAPSRSKPFLSLLTNTAVMPRPLRRRPLFPTPLYVMNNNSQDDTISTTTTTTCWNPTVRIVMGLLASAGLAETSFLTYSKLFGDSQAIDHFCGLVQGDCGSVLNGPYAVIPGLSVPLAALGMLAYSAVAYLALQPVLASDNTNEDDEDTNRVALAAISTGMGVFSACLMLLLYGVLNQSCQFCVASAVLSILLAKLAWATNLVPKMHTQTAIQSSVGASVMALVAASTLFFSNADSSEASVLFAGTLNGGETSSVVVTNQDKTEGLSPPPITTTSSPQAMMLATKLETLDTRLFGAYWCSHCYDQKQALGQAAMAKIQYVECSKEGFQAQAKLCRERDIPGYPTWEIAGKLYPGEQSLEELQEIVDAAAAMVKQ